MAKVDGAVWVISGANRGLGFELTKRVLEASDSTVVVAGCRDPSAADDLKKLSSSNGSRVFIVQLDVSSPDSVQAAAQQISQDVGQVDVLINNAGTVDPCEPAMVLDISKYSQVMRVNAIGPMDLTQQLMPLIRKGKGQTIVNISSIIGSHGVLEQTLTSDGKASESPFNSWQMAYRCSKSALNMQTQVLAAELKTHGYKVISIHPGMPESDMGQETSSQTGLPTNTLQESATGLLKVIHGLKPADTGKFLDWNGNAVPW
ncbi:hypothetical protein WJX74_007669 [Apatococcus lobatus]|uniref:Uncharacterized protein n=2 Tax=Apatococcus TaxID=904362 RepID=A0AAW1T7P0_9CHLO